MTKQGMRVVHLMLALGALWLIAPGIASAQVTITGVRVTIGGSHTAVYCDNSVDTACAGIPLWDLAGGIHLNGGETLVLTQTGIGRPNTTAGNFDTSDRF